MKNLPKISLIFLAIVSILALNGDDAFAAFSLSVTPFEGGQNIRFGNISAQANGIVNKEVTLRVTSNINKQYRVIQQILDPLSTADGYEVPYTSLRVYAIRGTNKYGTLSVTNEIPVSLSRSILYTSNTQGTPDSFQLVYRLLTSNVPAGSYRGRISYTLEPIDSSQNSHTVVLNVFAEVSVENAIIIQTQDGSKTISLKHADKTKHNFDVSFDIIGGLGQQFKVIQIIPQPLASPEGKELALESVNFTVRGNKRGVATSQSTALSKREQVIYTSNINGDPDKFLITYNLGDLSWQRPGRYKTTLKYILQGTGILNTGLLDIFNLEVENEKIFQISAASETGGINFLDLDPKDPPKISEVLIEVKTNLGKPYQVTQNVVSLLSNKAGDTIADKYFTMTTQSLDTKGDLKILAKSPVKKGDTLLFTSDKDGSPAQFAIVYELRVPREVKKGNYSTQILYSLSEI